MTKEVLIEMTKDKNVISMATSVLKAMAYKDVVTEDIEKKEIEILKRRNFRVATEFQRLNPEKHVLKPSDTYLLSDDDYVLFWDEMDEYHREKGYQKPEKKYCPKLMANSLYREAKRGLVEITEPYTGIKMEQLTLPKFDQLVEILLKTIPTK